MSLLRPGKSADHPVIDEPAIMVSVWR